jgi:hypothetical protein
MGRQFGLVHLSGRFGDLQLSVDGGKGYARQMDFVTPEKVRKGKNYELTRNNNREFNAAGVVADAVTEAIGGHWMLYSERFFRPRLQGKVRKLILAGPGDHGKRSFLVGPNKGFFKDMELDVKDPFYRRFRAQHSVLVNGDRNQATLEVQPFDSRLDLDVPHGATHFRLFVSVGVLSDCVYMPSLKDYGFTQEGLMDCWAMEGSGQVAIDGLMHPGLTMVVTLPGRPVLTPDAILLVSLGIRFVKVVNGVGDDMEGGGALRVVGAW